MTILPIVVALVLSYLVVTLAAAYLVQRFPRRPVQDPPDWGRIRPGSISQKVPGPAIRAAQQGMKRHWKNS